MVSLEYRHTNPIGRTILYGVALYDHDEDATSQVTREDRYSVAYADADVTVYENPCAYPRAFVVPEAVLAPDGPAALARLRDGPLDPRRQVVVESRRPAASDRSQAHRPPTPRSSPRVPPCSTSGPSAPAGGFLVLTDPFYPGWRALRRRRRDTDSAGRLPLPCR